MPHGARFLKLTAEAKAKVHEVTATEARSLEQGGALLIDVRETEEWAKERAAGAVHLSKGILEVKIEEKVPDPATPIVLYCGGGNRSALAAENLQRMGYTNVASLAGGFKAWKDQGLETRSSQAGPA
jgi:rhodanese-related sulfurtransferase